eukprot:augustus_masked-scaffold_29-processed-gene-0.58-mRNA-1 protein AED:1.00 eAED:1.00 QI:0/0/0/0/1/1/4/0/677
MSLPQRSCLTSTSTEGLECTSQREQRLLVVSVKVGGLTTTKLNLLEEKTQQLSILMLQELYESGYKMLKERLKVSTTYLAEELACNVSSVQNTSDRILKVVLQGIGKKRINVVKCYASHCGLGREAYKDFLKELSGLTRNLNKRRTLLLGGDFNTQVSRTALKKEGKLGFSKRSNANGKLLENWLKIKGYSIVNHRHLDHKITLELLNLKEEERDYEALTQIVPKLVEDLVPEQSSNTVEQRTSNETRELLRKKNSLWDSSTVGERKELTNAVKRSARKDKRNWYMETAGKIQLLFEQSRTREAYSLLNLVKPTAKTYARIAKDDKGNKVDTCQRLKILSDYIASQQLPPIPKIHLTQDERVHYCSPVYEPAPEEHINSNPPLMDEVMVCIRQLKNNRATGVDCINNEVLKASPAVQKILLREIQELFRKTSLSQRMKKQFCLGKIIHIYKQKGEKNSPGSYREKSLKAHLRSRFCDGTLNRRRAGTLAVKDTKYIVQKMLQPVAEPISVLGKEVQPVKEMKYLGAVFNSSGIAQEHVLSNLDKCESRLTKYRDILSCNTLTRKVKRQLARSMVLAPGMYNLGNWLLNSDIKKKLNFLTRKINSTLNNVSIQEYRFCEVDLDIQKILLEQRRKYVDADDATADRQVHILRENGINNHLEPKDPKYIYSPLKHVVNLV